MKCSLHIPVYKMIEGHLKIVHFQDGRQVSKWLPELIFLKCIQDLLVSKVPYAFRNSLFIPINVFQYALRYMFYVPFTKYRNILDGSHL